MKYLVIAENVDGSYYVDINLDFREALCDVCIWEEEYEYIEKVIKEESKKYYYKYKIIKFEE